MTLLPSGGIDSSEESPQFGKRTFCRCIDCGLGLSAIGADVGLLGEGDVRVGVKRVAEVCGWQLRP